MSLATMAQKSFIQVESNINARKLDDCGGTLRRQNIVVYSQATDTRSSASERAVVKRKRFYYSNGDQNSCESIISNDHMTRQRIRFVGEQLIKFMDHQDSLNFERALYNEEGGKYVSFPDMNSTVKVKTIWSIYSKLLKIEPIDNQWNYRQLMIPKDDKLYGYNITQSRQQVLEFIENLNGYCDSINNLRIILKGHPMISVLGAYNDIVDKIEKYNSNNETSVAAKMRSVDFTRFYEYSV